MPTYTALNTQIEAVKSEITASLAASTYTAQDLVYIAKTLETLGNLLGINDLVAASADAQVELNAALESILDGTAPANVGKLYVGGEAQNFELSAGLQDPAIIASINTPDYAQIAFQNKGSGANSSTDFIAYADNGTDSSGYIDMGFTSSNFMDPDFTITGKNDGYIFVEAPIVLTASVNGKSLTNNVATLTTPTAHGFRVGMPVVITGVDGVFNGTYTIASVPTTTSFTYAKTNGNVTFLAVSPVGTAVAGTTGKGNLVLATSANGTQNRIIFAAGGLADNNTQMIIDPDTSVKIQIATQSTSTTTGALVVAGGIGITGNLNVGGDVNITGTISFSGAGTTVSTANLAVVDPAVFVASSNSANLLDFTFAGKYVSSGNKWAVLSKKAADGIWYLASGVTTQPGNTVSYTGATYDTLYLGQLLIQTTPTLNAHAATKLYSDTTIAQQQIAAVMGIF